LNDDALGIRGKFEWPFYNRIKDSRNGYSERAKIDQEGAVTVIQIIQRSDSFVSGHDALY